MAVGLEEEADVVEGARRMQCHLQPALDRVPQMQAHHTRHHVHLGVLMIMTTPSCTVYEMELQ